MIEKIDIKGKSKEEWLKLREGSIGGSEIGSIIGLNHFESAYTLWCVRTGKKPAFEGNLATEVGTCLERFVAEKFAEKSGYGKRVQQTGFLYKNDKYPILHASPDRLIHSTTGSKSPVIAGLECKTTSEWNTKRFKGVDFPMQYYSQCVQYMMLLEVPVWYLAVLVGNREFHVYRLVSDALHIVPGDPFYDDSPWLDGTIVVDRAEYDALYEAAEIFWDHVKTDTPPAIDGSDSTTEMIKELHPESNGSTIFDPTIEFTCHQLDDVKKQIAELEKQQKEYENQLKDRMGEAEKMKTGLWVVSWKNTVTNRMDTTAFKKDHPDLAALYTKPSVSRRFEMKEDK